ncbi:MAG: MFS transporter [Acidobacteria bacterium]|nr:MFS transporter [Acidobacteriota bacterium]
MNFREDKWIALWAAMLGFMLDAMDVLLYVFALQTLRVEFGLSNAAAGLVSSATLLTSAVGGFLFGALADRIGRKRALMYTVLLYSFASAGTASSNGFVSLLLWRALIGLGLGGEWSTGALLVAESWPAKDRGKAIGLMQSGWAIGYIIAAGVTALVLPRFGWRVLFLVGLAPALLTILIRRKVKEPAIWKATAAARKPPLSEILRGPLGRRTLLATALSSSVMLGYWGLFTWLPGFLSASKAAGGAGLSLTGTSSWVIGIQLGAFAGYVTFGFLADRIGRRPAFFLYVMGAAVVTPLFGLYPSAALGPLVGFLGTGYFSLFGAMLAELYPTSIRGAAQGFTYNAGRAVSAAAPYLVGSLADRMGLGTALTVNAAFFLVAGALVFTLPETRGTSLDQGTNSSS